MKIADFSIKHPVIIGIFLVALTLFGIISSSSMKQEMFSEIAMPELVILTTYPGAGPEAVEREVSKIIEDSVSTVAGISEVESASYDSFSMVNIKFNYDQSIGEKTSDIREKINEAENELPEGIDTPQILQYSTAILPIFSFSIDSTLDQSTLDEYVENTVIPRISRISGVAEVSTQGSSGEEVSVTLRHEDLAASGLDILTVFGAIQANNSSLPAGQVRFQEQVLNVRLDGQYSSIEDIKNLVVGFKDNVFIYLSDIADVKTSRQDYELYVTQGEEQIVTVNILKQQGADTVKVIDEAKKTLALLEKESNNVVKFSVISDDSYNISLSIKSVLNSALLGAVLAVLVIFLFLHNVRSTIIISISLPCSILFSFCFMAIRGQGINLMTLAGLTVAVGMIVDNSIVVLENIYRHYVLTNDAKKAASIGTAEVGSSIIASTATTLVVFIPLLFLEGLTGMILSDIAYTIIWAIGSSAIAALVVVPFLSIFMLRPMPIKKSFLGKLGAASDKAYSKIEKKYSHLLKLSLANKKFVLFFAVFLLILSGFSAGLLGFEFLSETDMNEILITSSFPSTYNLEETKEKMQEMDVYIREIVPEVKTTTFSSGTTDNFALKKQANKGFAKVLLVPTGERERSVFDVIAILRKEIPQKFEGVDVSVTVGGFSQLLSMAVGGGGFSVELYGDNMDDLYASAVAFAKIVEQDAAVDEVTIDTNFDTQELVATIQQDVAATLGIQSQKVTTMNRILFSGAEAGMYREDGKSLPINVKSDLAKSTVTNNFFDNIYFVSETGSKIPLSVLVELNVESTVNQVIKKNKVQTITVGALLNNPDLRGLQNRILPQFEKVDLPSGIGWDVAGSAAFMADSFSQIAGLLAIAVFLVYMVMVIQFERFVQPLIVMVSIPFSFIGIVISLTLFGSTLSLISLLGVITLVGTVVNTAIVLIDYINLLRTSYGMSLEEAIISGCANRLRPILMSVLTTSMGLVPMIFAMGEGANLTAPLAQAIFGGLLSSTFVTLIFIPLLYFVLERKREEKQVAKNEAY